MCMPIVSLTLVNVQESMGKADNETPIFYCKSLRSISVLQAMREILVMYCNMHYSRLAGKP